MVTLLMKEFRNIKAIPVDGIRSPLSKNPADVSMLEEMLNFFMVNHSKSYVQDMPDWITAKYFDPNQERQRLLVNDYQQTELRNMRSMNDTKLVHCLEILLKSFEHILRAVKYMLRNGFSLYLSQFFGPFVGDWPTQLYMRQLAILALRPKAWRQSWLLEALSGDWSLIRDEITSVFHNCKEVDRELLLCAQRKDKGNRYLVTHILKAKEIDACKHQLQDCKSWFVLQRNYSYCPAKIKNLKLKAAKFLIENFEKIEK
eukprot:gene21242-23317_t